MKSLISNKVFYKRHDMELARYLVSGSSLHLINEKSRNKVSAQSSNVIYLDLNVSIEHQIQDLVPKKFDTIVVSDIFEVNDELIKFLKSISSLLNHDGKLILTSINTKWKFVLKFLELINAKQKTDQFSYIHTSKLDSLITGSGFGLVSTTTRQYFPFKFFYIGSFINRFFEIIFFNFHLGIKTYITLRKNIILESSYSRSIIIPAKNEEGNLNELVDRIPKSKKTELILSIGKSKDNTLQLAKQIQKNNNYFKIKVIEQTKNGKANAVWEAIDISQGEIIAILDSDLSVDPEELDNFFEIIEKNHADFVNGTRLIYEMEKGSMRYINKVGNRIFQYLIGKIINEPITDSLCGTKVFKKNLIENIKWWQKNYKLTDPFGDFDLLFVASYSGAKIAEYPIHYRARKYGTTQISRFKDGYKLIKYLVRSFIIINTTK